MGGIGSDAAPKFGVAIIRDLQDPIASRQAVVWAAGKLAEVCKQHSVQVMEGNRIGDVPSAGVFVVIGGPDSTPAREILQRASVEVPAEAEAFCIAGGEWNGQPLVAAAGADERGLVYAVLELADRIRYADEPKSELRGIGTIVERPATPVRSVMRSFVNELEDRPWFYDESFWDSYLTELATHRFNRFHLALGVGYDFGHDPGVRDNYLNFSYPFFLQVPGYEVRVVELSDEDRKKNLEMLRYIGEACKRRAIHFQLGLWNHAYQYLDSPNMNYTFEGITEQNHAAYCRDAIRLLLQECPSIDGVTLRVHYEGGIPEPNHPFWRIAMEGVATNGRKVEIDMHPKGVDDEMLELAANTGMPVAISPKFWAEHMGLPYHQTEIRKSEKPDLTSPRTGLAAITATNRRFTRYGYADYLKENRTYGVIHRIWPGTQRLLLWGDPELASGLGRSGTFCGSLGFDFFEPLSFKGRKGSGSAGGREPYADDALKLSGQEWKKYLYTYRLWGRLLYNPDEDPESWRRYLRGEFGAASEACEAALAHASRILPLITTAHGLAAANAVYWPENYVNQPIVKIVERTPYMDTAPPRTFGSISPFDPEMFYGIDEYAEDLLKDERRGKYSPLEVADWLQDLAETAERRLEEAKRLVNDPQAPAFRRWAIDVAVQAGIGSFFARKLGSGFNYSLYERTHDPELLRQALTLYEEARDAWAKVAEMTASVYREDLTFGYFPHLRGHWADRLPDIEDDVSAMAALYDDVRANPSAAAQAAPSIAPARSSRQGSCPAFAHKPPQAFIRGEAVRLSFEPAEDNPDLQVRLHYRRANQGENYQRADMTRTEGRFAAEIPASYTDSDYPLIYFFELVDRPGRNAWIAPGFGDSLANQPYYVLRQH